jgi:hypothetical protein
MAQLPNRTRNTRRLPKGSVRVTCRRGALDLGPNVAMSIVDMSAEGIRLVVKESLEPGKQVSVGLEGQTDRRPTVCIGSVVSCSPTPEGAYWAGIQFEKSLPHKFVLQISWQAGTI